MIDAANGNQAMLDPVALKKYIDERLDAGAGHLYQLTLHEMEQVLLTRVLQHTAGNQKQAAHLLGITRGSLRNKLRCLGITIKRTVETGGMMSE
jgi:two-component system nitrogen regulation response regulator GlnG